MLAIIYVPKEMVERLSKDPKIQDLKGPDTRSVNVSFNNSTRPFDDVRVRQVLGGCGIDRHTVSIPARTSCMVKWGLIRSNHKDPKIDELWDRLRRALTPEELSRLSHVVQRYVVGNMVQMSATTLPFIQAARDYAKGYVSERGFKIGFETTWLDRC